MPTPRELPSGFVRPSVRAGGNSGRPVEPERETDTSMRGAVALARNDPADYRKCEMLSADEPAAFSINNWSLIGVVVMCFGVQV